MKTFWKILFEKKELIKLEHILEQNNNPGLKKFLQNSAIYGTALGFLALAFGFYLQLKIFYLVLAGIICFAGPFLVQLLFNFYIFEKKKKEIERFVPDMLLQASAFPRKTPIGEIINYIAKSGYGELSKEFEKISREISKGSGITKALENSKNRPGSEIYAKALELLIQGYNSGAEMSIVFMEAAEEVLETQALLRERVANLMIEKYTLLFAGGVIVPVILGSIIKLIMQLSKELPGIGNTLTEHARNELLNTVLTSSQIYIIVYAILASIFVAQQESDAKKAIVYALGLVPLSVLLFNLVKL